MQLSFEETQDNATKISFEMQMLSVRCLEKIYVPPSNQNAFYICDNLDGWISLEGAQCNFSQFECNVSILVVWAAKCNASGMLESTKCIFPYIFPSYIYMSIITVSSPSLLYIIYKTLNLIICSLMLLEDIQDIEISRNKTFKS